MYWEEVIELIKTHGKEPKSTFPNEYNDSDEYVVYEYERGTVKTSYVHINEFSNKIKNCLKKYLKYGINNIQIFSSLGASEGIGLHDDPTHVLIYCLEGEMSYIIEGKKPVILKSGDTIFIKKGIFHKGISSTVPRICLSCELHCPTAILEGSRFKNEVTYYFE
tara:strand:+ start:232 stop:723 length:492 start_codon:yes stop_codon:yes gene_type:complete